MVPMVHCTNKLIIVILLYYDPDYLGTILLPLGVPVPVIRRQGNTCCLICGSNAI